MEGRGKKQLWAEAEVEWRWRPDKAPDTLVGGSGESIILQRCPMSDPNGWIFISPPHLVTGHGLPGKDVTLVLGRS